MSDAPRENLETRLAAGLIDYGYTETTSRSKYRTFRNNAGTLMFVGKNGALRTGRNASNSISIGDAARHSDFYTLLLTRGDAALHPERKAIDGFLARLRSEEAVKRGGSDA